MTSPPLISGPVPPYTNPPINPQYYQPSAFFISAISLGQTTTVTTTVANNYVLGQLVRLIIPNGYGSTQLNNQTGNIISILAPNQMELDLFSLYTDLFIPSSSNTTQPQTIAVGDVNSGFINNAGIGSQGTYVPGSFINISPV